MHYAQRDMKPPRANPLDVLRDQELASSDELIRRLKDAGVAHPRKVLQRKFRAAGIWRSKSLVLPTGARLFARRTYYGTERFLADIAELLRARRPGLARVIGAMDQLPAIDIDTVKKLVAVRLNDSGEGACLDRELAAIEEAGIGVIEESGTARKRLVRTRYRGTDESEALGLKLLAEVEIKRHLLAILLRHYKLQNIIAWNTPEPGAPGVYNGGQLFDFMAFSRLRPLRRKSGESWKSGPVPFDVVVKAAELYDVDGFIERLHRAGDHKGSRFRPLGIMGARSFSTAALQRGKEFGLVLVNFKELFGEAALDAITKAQELMAALATENEAAIDTVADRLAESVAHLKDNPMVSTLCGVAFETLAVAILRGRHCEEVRAGLDVPWEEDGVKTTRDVDASGRIEDNWQVVECKALRAEKSVDQETIRKFYTETVPAFLDYIGKSSMQECRAEIWTTGCVSAEADTYFKSLRHNRRVKPKILTRREITVPRRLKKLERLMDVIAAL